MTHSPPLNLCSSLQDPICAHSTSHTINGVCTVWYTCTGEELSGRGQGVEATAAPQTLRALLNLSFVQTRAARVRVQTEENAFRCGQMATGRFYKMARCAELAEARARERGEEYDYLLVLRPDVLYHAPFELPPPSCFNRPDLPTGATNWVSYNQEVLLTPWVNVGAIKALEKCACCDSKARKPKGCFHMGFAAPWIQFLYRQHFTKRKLVWLQSGAQQAKAKCLARWGHAIVRPQQERPDVDWGNLTNQHGVYRRHVEQRSAPAALPPERLLERASWDET